MQTLREQIISELALSNFTMADMPRPCLSYHERANWFETLSNDNLLWAYRSFAIEDSQQNIEW